jgi:hypothetical protein
MSDKTSIEEKQIYLRENILEKGYDANLFANYLIQKKGEEGADIGSWSMNDLQQVVQEFIEKQSSFLLGGDIVIPPTQNQNEIPEEQSKPNNQEETKSISKNENKNDHQNEASNQQKEVSNIPQVKVNPQLYGIVSPETLPCKKPENTPLSSIENLSISVGSPEKKEGGFFSKSYITYLITTHGINLTVRRRYSDFVWLHQVIFDLYSYIIVPPVPKKNKIGGDRFSDIFINKRMRYLEKFLNWLASNPVIKNSKLFYDFLSIEKEADFNKSKTSYNKIKPQTNIQEFISPNGKMNLGVKQEKEIYFQNIKDNIFYNQELLNKLNINLKQLKLQMDALIQKIIEVSKIWEELFNNSTKYYDEMNIINTYKQMNKLFKNWEECLKKQNNLIFVDVREYFKYIRNNFREMKYVNHNADNHKSVYYKVERNLINKKEELFKRGDISKWELDGQEKSNANILSQDKSSSLFKICSKDTNTCIQRRIYYGYYLNKAIEEFERVRALNGKFHKENFMNFCRNLSDIISEFHKSIAENLTALFVEDNKIKQIEDKIAEGK